MKIKEIFFGKKKAKEMVFGILAVPVFMLMLVLLELCKNTVWGFVLSAVLVVGFTAAYTLIIRLHDKWYLNIAVWAAWFALFAGVFFLTSPPVKSVPAVDVKNPAYTEIVKLRQGELQGVYNRDKSVEVYAGIPYAQPPVGELRWREPQDAQPWEGVLKADAFAPMSMQQQKGALYDSLSRIIGYHDYEITLDDNYTEPVSEDSLYLNIWKPAGNAKKLPVMVYIHGGSLNSGQPWYRDYNGESLARDGVIVVNMGYRLGVFGYFADEELAAESPNGTTGNYGLLDQIKALEWVRDNISAFGGDPENVTLSGESAGSASVSALCTSPLAKGLFKRAILESSTLAPVNPPHSFRTMDEALETGKKTKAQYGCKTAAELRKLSAEELVSQSEIHHHITIDGYALTETPFESYKKGVHNEQEILHGYNSEESAPFIVFDHANLGNYETKVRGYFKEYSDDILSLYPAKTDEEADRNWAEVYGAVFFDYPHYCLNRLAAENDIPVYEYYFNKSNGRLGAWHSGEIIYCYGNIPAGSRLFDSRDRELSGQMLGYWSNFAKSGDPNGSGLPEWTQNKSSDRVMLFGDRTEMISEREHELFAIFDKMENLQE